MITKIKVENGTFKVIINDLATIETFNTMEEISEAIRLFENASLGFHTLLGNIVIRYNKNKNKVQEVVIGYKNGYNHYYGNGTPIHYLNNTITNNL